jgi:hypothetical protein
MPTADDEFEPSLALVERVVRRAIAPYHARFERSAGVPLPASISVWAHKTNDDVVSFRSRVSDAAAVACEIRLRFRRTYRDDRTLWSAQALAPEAVMPDGVFGYLISGEILGSGRDERVRLRRTWTDRFLKQHKWQEWQW